MVVALRREPDEPVGEPGALAAVERGDLGDLGPGRASAPRSGPAPRTR